ncbi:hypothetical protein HY605_00720 [Candidatus Peregrinibacteria bacterium]|nr:hypothetical protein [Candidatus Peregrinibacteria bacterium]
MPGQFSKAVIDDTPSSQPLVGSPGANPPAQCFDLTIKKDGEDGNSTGARLTVNYALTIYGSLTIEGTSAADRGEMTVNLASGKNLSIKGNISDSQGGFINTTKQSDGGRVIMSGSTQQEIQNSISIYELQISNNTIIKQGVDLTITSVLSTDSFIVDSGKTFTMQGDGATAPKLKFADGAKAGVSGTFKATKTASNPKPVISNNGSGTFTFVLSGPVDIGYLVFGNGDANGMQVSSSATFTYFDGIDFNNAASGGRHLKITKNVALTINCPAVTFDASGGYNVDVSGSAGNFTIVFVYANDLATGAPGRYRGDYAELDSATAEVVWVGNVSQVDNAGSEDATELGGVQGYVFSNYAIVRRGTPGNPLADRIVAYDANGNITNTLDIPTDKGEIVGRPLVLGDIFFGTKGGWVYRVGADLSIASGYPDNLGGGAEIGAINEIYSPIISDTGWGGDNIYFMAKNTNSGNTYFYGLDMNIVVSGVHAYVNTADDTTDPGVGDPDPMRNGNPFPRTFGDAITYSIPSEPAIDALTIGGSRWAIFISSKDDGSGADGVGHIWRISKQLESEDIQYSGALPPNSDVTSPVNEWGGILTIASTDTGAGANTPRVYLIESNLTGQLQEFSGYTGWPALAGSGVDGGVDQDFSSYLAYGTNGGTFDIKNFADASSFAGGFPITPDGANPINCYPLWNVSATHGNVYYFGNDNGKVYKVEYGNNEGFGGDSHDGWTIDSNNVAQDPGPGPIFNYVPFLDVGSGVKITGLSFIGGKLAVSCDNGAVYLMDTDD